MPICFSFDHSEVFFVSQNGIPLNVIDNIFIHEIHSAITGDFMFLVDVHFFGVILRESLRKPGQPLR